MQTSRDEKWKFIICNSKPILSSEKHKKVNGVHCCFWRHWLSLHGQKLSSKYLIFGMTSGWVNGQTFIFSWNISLNNTFFALYLHNHHFRSLLSLISTIEKQRRTLIRWRLYCVIPDFHWLSHRIPSGFAKWCLCIAITGVTNYFPPEIKGSDPNMRPLSACNKMIIEFDDRPPSPPSQLHSPIFTLTVSS